MKSVYLCLISLSCFFWFSYSLPNQLAHMKAKSLATRLPYLEPFQEYETRQPEGSFDTYEWMHLTLFENGQYYLRWRLHFPMCGLDQELSKADWEYTGSYTMRADHLRLLPDFLDIEVI